MSRLALKNWIWIVLPLDVLLACTFAGFLMADPRYQSVEPTQLAFSAFFAAVTLGLCVAYVCCGLAKLLAPSRVQFLTSSFKATPLTTLIVLALINLSYVVIIR